MSLDKISRELTVRKLTVITWYKEYENEIANLKAVEVEAILASRHYL